MPEQIPKDSFAEALRTLVAEIEGLDTTVDQVLQVLRKRGLQFSIDVGEMAHKARQTALALQQSSQAVNEKLRLLEELVRTSTLINSSLEVNQVLEDVIDTIISLTGAERAYLLLRDRDSGKLTTRTARNGDRETLAEDETVFSSGVINTAITQRAPVITTNAQTDARFQDMKSVFSHSLRSIICIPIILHDNIIGILYADNRIGEGVFKADYVPILTVFGNQAAIAIENARLFGRVKEDLVKARNEVEQLKVQIDQSKLQKQLNEVVDSDFFQHVQQLGQQARKRNAGRSNESE